MHEPIDIDAVEVFRENSTYRIGDLFYRKGVRWEKDRAAVLREPHFGSTILHDYLVAMNHEEDFATLGRVVRAHVERNGYPQPPADELVIHLRLGDLMQRGLPYGKRRHRRAHRMYETLARQLSASGMAEKTATIV
ncbi:MAG: hypothetical protein IH940_11415, partial [Acidobacteria bacterium]|nr:hypothetical protein [Acidobacteriota bacterium]